MNNVVFISYKAAYIHYRRHLFGNGLPYRIEPCQRGWMLQEIGGA